MKYLKIVISLVLVLCFFTACDSTSDFYLTYNEKNLLLNNLYNEEEYGKANSSFESPDCAFGNRDITYIYDEYEIETYGNDNDELIVYSIYFTGENNENSKTN